MPASRRISRALTALVALALAPALLLPSPASATDTGAVTQVTAGDNKSTVPVISGSGDELVFHSSATDIPDATQANPNIDDIYVADTSGMPFTFAAYSDGDTGERASFPDMSPNGKWIVFTRIPNGSTISQVVRIDTTNGNEVSITGDADSGVGNNVPGARVDNGGNVVFTSLATNLTSTPEVDDGRLDIYWWGGSGNATKISGDLIDTDFVNPDISASGGIIVYNSDDGAGDKDIFSNNSTGGIEANLTADGDGQHELAKVNDDGTSMTFRSDSTNLDGGNNTFNVFVYTAGSFNRITNGVSPVTSPNISGDGAYVAYQVGGEIYRTDVATSTPIQVSDNTAPGPIDFPTLSEDGSRIVFAMSTDGSVPGVQIHLWEENAVPEAPNAPVPDAPSVTDTSVDVAVTVNGDSGSPITSVTVTASPGGVSVTEPAPVTTVSMTGLNPSTEYTFTAVATNANGDSLPSPASTPITTEATPGAPDAPTGVTAVANGETEAVLIFTAPNDNGSGITGYIATASPGGQQATGGDSPIVFTGLEPGTTYTFTVQAENAFGTGPASASSNAITTVSACGTILSPTYQGMSGSDGRIARLYAAYFLRSPDTGGFQFWQARIAAGEWTNDDAATFFSESPEFVALYGSGLSNAQFIDLLYENVLCRTADAGGKAYWLNLMTNEGATRGQVALGFSDSAEFKTRTSTN